ncbi:MAG: glycosyltransferase family 4 protein [Terrimicrobiaceae bacterium]|nr:glycosyltransferase family 4 protein [Terrimicrobiaceae bacterium]
MRRGRAILFTSLPRVGGHSTITLGLAPILRQSFGEVEIWCKPMPDHGHSESSQAALEALGCRVVLLADPDGRLNPAALARAVAGTIANPPDLFIALAMRNLAPVLAQATRARRSIYYHITHDLHDATVAFLRRCLRAFHKLAFICPATYEDFPREGIDPARLTWVPQLSEIPVENPEELIASRASDRGPLRIGLIGRLTEQKGARVMLDFARTFSDRGELHLAGSGPFEDDFRQLALTDRPLAVTFHGRYDPADRARFLRNFFAGLDWLVVPSQDEWETLSMAVLEALQHGVPALVCQTGGLRSFRHTDLGPPADDIIRLIPADAVASSLEMIFSKNEMCTSEKARRCREHYERFFSNDRVAGRWSALFNG